MRNRDHYGANDPWLIAAVESGKYLVTPDGRVWNLDFRGTGSPVECAQHSNTFGYMVVNIEANERKLSALVHRLVLLRYLGPHAERKIANHRDGVKTNNHVENLEWVTQSENVTHAWGTGLRSKPDGKFRPKLTPADIEAARKLRAEGVPLARIAFQLGVTRSAIHSATKESSADRPGHLKYPGGGFAARLTEDEVREIHRRYISHSRTSGTRVLCQEFGIGKAALLNIISGKSWPHIYREFHP